MASTGSNLLQNLSLPRVCPADAPKRASKSQATVLLSRRQSLILLTASTALTAVDFSARAEDIPLFGLRKKLKKAEEEAEVILKEGFETAEKGIEAAEKGIIAAERGVETAERQIITAEKEIETAAAFSFGGGGGGGGGLTQAGVVIGAELVGILVATSVVNGILGPES